MGNGFPLENNNTSVALSSWFKIYICRRTGRKKYNKKYKVQDTKKQAVMVRCQYFTVSHFTACSSIHTSLGKL